MNTKYTAANADKNEYFAVAYYRLSKDDKAKSESDSITNQRKLISSYVDSHSNIKLVEEHYDDGYTGTNFDRPGFRAVMAAIKERNVNCVIVKDLSRLGREYIEMGRYIETVFPSLGVRFIAINDDVDSSQSNDSDDIIIPIKNIMNESYCRELSKKLRKQFQIQRANGEFLGAFASYGYLKSPDNKHKIIIDEYAAEIVRGIFLLKIRGYSGQGIADFLNKERILPPAEYKKSIGLNYKSGFKGLSKAKWSAVTVGRILQNPIYIGTLIQGKRGTPNYKIKKMRVRDEDDWSVVKNNHPPIIDETIFSVVGRMLARDTRKSPNDETVSPLSGVLFCGDCERTMAQRSVTRGNKKFYYYICSTYKYRKSCSSHNFEQKKLEKIILNAITNQINLVIEINEMLKEIGESSLTKIKIKRFDMMIAQKNSESDRYNGMRAKLYEALNGGLIDRDEYEAMRSKYSKLIYDTEQSVESLKRERSEFISDTADNNAWINEFIRFNGAKELTRELVVTFIDRIYVYENKRIKIDFNYRNELSNMQELLELKAKEAIKDGA